jgi:hypothetical protein
VTGRALIGAVLVLLVAAPEAMAGTAAGRLANGRLNVTFRAAPGERNGLRLLPHSEGVRIFDAAAITAGESCRQVSEHEVRCGPSPAEGIALVAYAGDGPDSAYVRFGSARLGRGDDFGVGTTLYGGSGQDRLIAAGPSRLSGGGGDDVLIGRRGDDLLEGDASLELLVGGSGADRVAGGAGSDQIAGGHGRDRISGGPGHDFVRAADGDPDEIHCGSGRDRAFVDRGDNVSGCERVTLGWPG